MKKNILCLLMTAVLLWGCGKKGPLVLDPEKRPLAVKNLKLRQIGYQIEVSWEFPALLSDNQTPMNSAQVRSMVIYHLDKPVSPSMFEKKSDLLARPKFSELIRLDPSFSYLIPFKGKQLKNKEHAIALAYQLGRSRSALSAVEKISTLIPPEPIRDLKISREGKVIILNWSRPQVDSEGQPLPSVAGYRVYRRITPGAQDAQGKSRGAFKALPRKAEKGEYFEDRDTGVDGEYEYQVDSVLNDQVESAPSNPVKLSIQDTFPPDVPNNLVSFTAKDHIFLSWEAVPDSDLDHYIIYRRIGKEEEFKPLDAAVTDNFFRDRQITKGKVYSYAVSAVDKKGNESELSRVVRQPFN